LVVLHGLTGSKEIIPGLIDPLQKHFRCLVPDLPGHGGLSSEGINSLEDFANYIIDLTYYLNLNKFGLLGFSFGGNVVLKIAEILNKKGQVIPTACWATPVCVEKPSIKSKAKGAIALMNYLPPVIYRKVTSTDLLYKALFIMGIKLKPGDIAAIKKFDTSVCKKFVRGVSEEIDLNKHHPHLYVFGTDDVFVDTKIHEKLSARKRNSVLIEKGGHFPTEEGRAKAVSMITRFFKKELKS
jgi:pimeloyl-ACP methyl ester carboxylesterase